MITVYDSETKQDIGVRLYTSTETADAMCLTLSQHMDARYTVMLNMFSRIKATYIKGKRVYVEDYRKQYYPDLCEQTYQATKIKDATTAEWI